MTSIDQLLDAVSEYRFIYRLELDIPAADNLYDLEDGYMDSKPWPSGDRAGIYAIFGEKAELLYVGKARILNNRLSSYFRYDNSPSGQHYRCVHPDEGWGGHPRRVLTVPVSRMRPWEAASLEEYLIYKLQPPGNTIGIVGRK